MTQTPCETKTGLSQPETLDDHTETHSPWIADVGPQGSACFCEVLHPMGFCVLQTVKASKQHPPLPPFKKCIFYEALTALKRHLSEHADVVVCPEGV